jgi:2-amino-4-hydroxy-6-hydroxymethyldihydropteridine diphosphokinase
MEPTGASVLVYLGLGANLGDREATFQGAIEALRAAGVVPLRRAPLYESEYLGPWGPQPPYLNTVLEARTEQPPIELLRRTKRVEAAFGRRPETHLRPRTLDIDILLYADWTIRHRRSWCRTRGSANGVSCSNRCAISESSAPARPGGMFGGARGAAGAASGGEREP